MSDARLYTGGCHCGSVRFEVTTDLKSAISCNCSICTKRGLILTFVPPENFTLLSGEGQQADYQFNTKNIHHLFCRTCGIESFGTGTTPDGKTMIAVNIRCLEDIDLSAIQTTPVDGRNF